jgi:hypothetical protein
MESAGENNTTEHDDKVGRLLLERSLSAGFIAIVFGACLLTILDARRPITRGEALSGKSGSSQNTVAMITAAY